MKTEITIEVFAEIMRALGQTGFACRAMTEDQKHLPHIEQRLDGEDWGYKSFSFGYWLKRNRGNDTFMEWVELMIAYPLDRKKADDPEFWALEGWAHDPGVRYHRDGSGTPPSDDLVPIYKDKTCHRYDGYKGGKRIVKKYSMKRKFFSSLHECMMRVVDVWLREVINGAAESVFDQDQANEQERLEKEYC